jgi:hypothetical protein
VNFQKAAIFKRWCIYYMEMGFEEGRGSAGERQSLGHAQWKRDT